MSGHVNCMLARIGAFGGNNELYDEDDLRINCNCQRCNISDKEISDSELGNVGMVGISGR